MNRRAARWLAPIRLLIAALAFVVVAGTTGGAATATAPEPSPEPPVTANEFLPEDRDLSDCVGLVEKPGCGSKERGGALLNVVFVLVMAGMAFIFWRIIIGVRKNRAELDRATAERTAADRAAETTESIDP